MAIRRLPKVQVRKTRRPAAVPPRAFKPQTVADNAEVLTGSVQDLQASAPEERLARALSKQGKVQGFQFRYTLGAPRGLPGWKEVDYLVNYNGLIYPIEVDTLFTHREKKASDVLHDAIILTELNKLGVDTYPHVTHLSGDTELDTQANADKTAKRLFG